MAHTIVISIDGNADLREALNLKKDGYCFHINPLQKKRNFGMWSEQKHGRTMEISTK